MRDLSKYNREKTKKSSQNARGTSKFDIFSCFLCLPTSLYFMKLTCVWLSSARNMNDRKKKDSKVVALCEKHDMCMGRWRLISNLQSMDIWWFCLYFKSRGWNEEEQHVTWVAGSFPEKLWKQETGPADPNGVSYFCWCCSICISNKIYARLHCCCQTSEGRSLN